MKLVERFHRARFNWVIRAMLGTAPLRPGTEDFTALSMVHHRDVLPYLLALKSFARHTRPARVVLVADPTLDAADRQLLKAHVPHIDIREAAEFQREGIPKGGCWERLSAISHLAQQGYVVQLDADTVAVGELTAVRQAIRDGVSFTLGTEDVQPILPCTEMAVLAQQDVDANAGVQLLAEAALDRFDPTGTHRYARGCAGFAGFAKGALDPDRVLDLSQRMSTLLGPKWSAWGTEQFASNLLVCSSPGGRLLPHPDYCAPTRITPKTVFLHFIGFIRFRDGLYARTAQRLSRELAQAQG
jgi:rhodanese-related sulfurtransferase